MIYVLILAGVLLVLLGCAAWWVYSTITGGADAVGKLLRRK